MAGPFAPLLVALLFPASGLRTTPPKNVSVVELHQVRESHVVEQEEAVFEVAEGETMHVPALASFRSTWAHRYGLETRLQEPMPASVQLVMGVMTLASEGAAEYRQTIRETWLKQTGVCLWSRRQQRGCSVYVAFVMGNRSPRQWRVPHHVEQSAHGEPGTLLLDTVENMNNGKSPLWFETALEMFPWATHIGKMDMDTYPFLHKLVARMDQNRSCVARASPYEFIGRPAKYCNHKTDCTFRSACREQSCLGLFHSPQDETVVGEPWHFIAGELYVLSRPLVALVDWRAHRPGNEDIVTSLLVDRQAAKSEHCVAIRRLDVSAHKLVHVSREFANRI